MDARASDARPGAAPLRRTRPGMNWLLLGLGVCTGTGLATSLWFFFWTTPLSFALFGTVGQGSLLLGAGLYLAILARDLMRREGEKREGIHE